MIALPRQSVPDASGLGLRPFPAVGDPPRFQEPVKRRVNGAGAVAGDLAPPEPPGWVIRRRVDEDVEDVHDHRCQPDLRGTTGTGYGASHLYVEYRKTSLAANFVILIDMN